MRENPKKKSNRGRQPENNRRRTLHFQNGNLLPTFWDLILILFIQYRSHFSFTYIAISLLSPNNSFPRTSKGFFVKMSETERQDSAAISSSAERMVGMDHAEVRYFTR